ncbi:MAG: hypothetical protein O3A00_27275 [Planctomycetota bacterium]|nr:hypothetical protein [Planctomycetota bacterium]
MKLSVLQSRLMFAAGLIVLPTIARGETKSLAESVPPGAIAFGEIFGLKPVIQRIQDSEIRQQVLASPQYKAFEATPQHAKMQAGKTLIEGQIGMDLWTAGKQLLGGQVGVAVYPQPGRKQPNAVAIVRATEAGAIKKLYERLQPVLTLAGVASTETIGDVQVYALQGKLFVGVSDDWLAAASTKDLLTKTVGLLTKSDGNSLASASAYQSMTRQMGSEHLIRGFVNLDMIRQSSARLGIPKKSDNPIGSLLASGILELAVRSSFFGITLDVHDKGFALTAGIEGDTKELGQTYESFFSAATSDGAPRLPQVKDLMGGFSLHRNFADWYRHREDLIQDQVLPGFDKFESGLANIMPGKDFGTDVLPLFGSNISFLAAPQSYDHLDGKPGVQLPGFAMIIELADAGGYDIAQLFFQTLVTITNLEAGKQGRQPWVMSSETHDDTQIAYAKFLKKPKGDRLPIVFNFVPASARVGNKFVLTSSISLCRQIVDELKKPAVPEGRNRNLNLEVHFGPIADMLATNREFFAAREIQKGKSSEEVNSGIDFGLKLIRSLDSFRLSSSVNPKSFQAQLEGQWK